MATQTIVRRLANPQGRGKRYKAKRHSNPAKSRRRFSPAQIAAGFGGKRRRNGLIGRKRKSSTRRVSRASAYRPKATNPMRRRYRRRATRSNPVLAVTLGAVNPTRSKTVAKRRTRRAKAHNPRRHRRTYRRAANSRRRTRRNPVIVVTRRRKRRTNPTYKRRSIRRSYRRRNPELFGSAVTSSKFIKAIAGGLVGMSASKLILPALPAQLTGNNFVKVGVAAAVAVAGGMLVAKADREFGNAFMFGGLMQAGSVALNAFFPSIAQKLAIGDLTYTAGFNLPSNPMLAPAPVAAPTARMGVSGLNRAFGSAF